MTMRNKGAPALDRFFIGIDGMVTYRNIYFKAQPIGKFFF